MLSKIVFWWMSLRFRRRERVRLKSMARRGIFFSIKSKLSFLISRSEQSLKAWAVTECGSSVKSEIIPKYLP